MNIKNIMLIIAMSSVYGSLSHTQPMQYEYKTWQEIHKKYKDAVVKITSYVHEFNLKEPYKAPNQNSGTGTGFFINKDGHLLTNFHVVADAIATFIEIPSLFGKEYFEIEPVKLYPGYDLAHMKLTQEAQDRLRELLDGQELNCCILGNSDLIAESEEVMTVGYPLGFDSKASTGIISGFQDGLVQTTTPQNPGNSGGPYFNKNGEIIGVAVSGIEKNGERIIDGISFFIPINLLFAIQKDTSNNVIVRNPFWGMACTASSIDMLKYFGSPYTDRGIRISEVQQGSRADVCGIKAGDFIFAVNGTKVDRFGYLNVNSAQDRVTFYDFLSRLDFGSTVTFSVFREGVVIDLTCEVNSEHPFQIKRYFPWYEKAFDYEVIAGMVFVELTLNHIEFYKEMKKHYNIEPSSFFTMYADSKNRLEPRVAISHIFYSSKLHKTSCFREDDSIIKKINGEPVATIDQLREAIKMGIGEKYLTIECEGGSFAAFSVKDLIEEENILPGRYGYTRSPLVDFLAQGL